MQRIKRLPLLFIFTTIFSCAVGPQLSPMQKRQITTKMIKGAYEDAYRSTLTILQDQGYVIKNTDMSSGLIVANVDRAESGGSQFAQALFLGYVANKGTEVEVSCMINKITTNQTEIRMNIQEVNYGQSSAWSGTSKQNSKQIYTPEIYRNLFNQIEIEVQRRQAIANSTSGFSNQPNYSYTPVVNTEADKEINTNEEFIFSDYKPEPVLIDILNTAKGMYLLVHQNDETPMKVGESYKLVSLALAEIMDTEYPEIGIAKVVQVKNEKVALKYELNDSNTVIDGEVKLKYR